MLPGLRVAALAVMIASTAGCYIAPSHSISFSSATAQFPADVEGRIQRIEQRAGLAQRMAQYGVPGVSIAVVNRGVVEWARGYGACEAGGAKVTQETLFQAASVSKPVTAVVALKLVQDGQLGLDEDINRYLKGFRLPPGRDGRSATLRQLLSHSAGVSVHGFAGYEQGTNVPKLADILHGRRPANNRPIRIVGPQGRYAYSGGGFTIVQQAVSDAGGAPFGEVAYEEVLRPLGMSHSTFDQPLPTPFQSWAAAGHDANGYPLRGKWRTHPELAAAGLWTTPTDLARLIVEIQSALAGRGRVLSAPIAQQMITRQSGNFGLGLNLSGSGRGARFDHGGVNAGYRATIVGFAYSGQGVVVMSNGDNGGQLNHEIVSVIGQEYGWSGRGDAYGEIVIDDEDDARLAEVTAAP